MNFNNTKEMTNENDEKDKYLGLLIDKEIDYNEFVGLLTQLIKN